MGWRRDARLGLYLGGLALCWLLTLEFRRSLPPLLQAREISAGSAKAERLASLTHAIETIRGRDGGWPLPRLGLAGAEALAAGPRRRLPAGQSRPANISGETRTPELRRREAREPWRQPPANVSGREAGFASGFAGVRSASADATGEYRRKWREALGRLAALTNDYAGNLAAVRRAFRRGGMNFTDRFLPGDGPGGSEGDPLEAAELATENLEQRLASHPDDPARDDAPPRALFNQYRLASVRLAAFSLDAMWRENVLHPWSLHPGDPLERWRRLTEPGGLLDNYLKSASGLWRLDDGRLTNAEWDGISFMFNRKFLNFVDWCVGEKHFRRDEPLSIAIGVTRVDVDSGARERPTQLELVWRTAAGDRSLVYRNYPAEALWEWKPGASAKIRLGLSLPAVSLEKDYSGEAAVSGLLRAAAGGKVVLRADDFPEKSGVLRRLGISGIAIHSRLREPERLLKWLDIGARRLPQSVIELDREMDWRPNRPEPDFAERQRSIAASFSAHPESFFGGGGE
ncbi:MAG: hypothetical protein LBU23_12860 [Planctomycetota bacterium]|jgi:hypothetical protein|nr:hypothetical protein [Planctomycetota bacterium]